MQPKTDFVSPVFEEQDDWLPVSEEISRVLRTKIYLPLSKILSQTYVADFLENASAKALIAAIRSGRIHHHRGQFKGRFSSEISRELRAAGAKWDRTQGCWKVPLSLLPANVRRAISMSEKRWQANLQAIDKKLAQVSPDELIGAIKLEDILDTSIFRVDRRITKTLEKIAVQPVLTDEQKKQIADDYLNNMKLDIKGWAAREVKDLRQVVQKRAMSGQRYEGMVAAIERSYGVSRAKAKFLARQESLLMTAALKESRYRDAGIKKYEWRCSAGSKASPVRPLHKKLDGKIFSWDNPPIVDNKGNRKHPGQDYGCRCYARPIVEF